MTPYIVDGFALVLRHRRIPFVSYPHEWCAATFRDAVLTCLDLLAELGARGLTFQDGNLANMLLDDGKLVYVDVGSIIAMGPKSPWPGRDEFEGYAVRPLRLMACGQERIARLLMCEDDGVRESEFSAITEPANVSGVPMSLVERGRSLVGKTLPGSFRRALKAVFRTTPVSGEEPAVDLPAHLDYLRGLRRDLARLDVSGPSSLTSRGNEFAHTEPEATSRVAKVLDELRPASVLCVGRQVEAYARLAARCGSRVVAIDDEPLRVTRLYEAVRGDELPILPLLMDVTKPTPERGILGHWTEAATERLACDFVLAMGLVAEIVYRRRLLCEHAALALAQFSRSLGAGGFSSRHSSVIARICE